jgi:hypothetical protein
MTHLFGHFGNSGNPQIGDEHHFYFEIAEIHKSEGTSPKYSLRNFAFFAPFTNKVVHNANQIVQNVEKREQNVEKRLWLEKLEGALAGTGFG